MSTELFACRQMSLADYPEVIDLMRRSPGVSVRDADSAAAIGRYLERNPGLSFVAEREGKIIGCVMGGHDGRRGYLYHLAVAPDCRRLGIGRALVGHALAALAGLGIHKTHIDVYRDNGEGRAFWAAMGWQRRDELDRYSVISGGGANA